MPESWAYGAEIRLKIEAYSAGIEKHAMNPNAVKVMAKAGVDITGHHSMLVSEVIDVPFDYGGWVISGLRLRI